MTKLKSAKCLFVAICSLAYAGIAIAAPTAEQKAEVVAVGELVKQAGNLFKEKKFKECGEVIKQAQAKSEALAGTGERLLINQIEPLYKRIASAHALLELEGVELPEFKAFAEIKGEKPTAEPKKPKDDPKAQPAGGAGTISFVKHVVPVLIGKCGSCHVTGAKGGFGMPTYAALMKGSKDGKVVFPGDAEGSRLIEVIESGDMPRGGGKLSVQEFDALKKWIVEGAKFDGGNENMELVKLVSGAPVPATPTPTEPTIVQATGKETVSFAKELAPVIASTCVGCHGTQNPRANFSQANFANFMKGGDSGSPVTAGNPAESLLIKKLKGTGGGQRMPAGGLPPLADTVIAKFEKWIEEGAKFDGPDANSPMAQVAALARAAGATHQELIADRKKAADQTWNTSMPGVKFDEQETEHFLIRGTVGENTLKDLAQKADQFSPKVAEILGAPSDQPLVKGRLTVFVVKERYDFSEIAKVLTGLREIPPTMKTAWRYDGVDASAVIRMPKSEAEYGLEAVLAQQLAAVHCASSGKVTPRWFAEGVGRAVASRVASADPRVREWDTMMPAVFQSLPHPAAFMEKEYDADAGGIAAYSFARYLMSNTAKFNALMTDLRKGGKFDERFAANYGGPPAATTQLWYKKGPGKPAKPKK